MKPEGHIADTHDASRLVICSYEWLRLLEDSQNVRLASNPLPNMVKLVGYSGGIVYCDSP